MPTYRFYQIKNIEDAYVDIAVKSHEEIIVHSYRTKWERLIWLSNNYPDILFYRNIVIDEKYGKYDFRYYCRKNTLTVDKIKNLKTDLDTVALGEELGRTDFGGIKTMEEIVKELKTEVLLKF